MTRWVRCATRIAACALVVTGASVVVAVPAARAGIPTALGGAAAEAVDYARAHHVTAAVAVLDENTGTFVGAGDYTATYGSASVMKLFVATELLATGRMHGATAGTAYAMITRSDDTALERLLPRVGGTAVISWVEKRYGIEIGRPSPKPACWGNTQITARGVARFYAHMQRDHAVAGWLMDALHHHATYGADGTRQDFGVAAAAPGAAVKQGWGICSSDTGGSVLNSTGVVDGDRYAVVILTDTDRGHADARGFNAGQAGVVTAMAEMVLPHGRIAASAEASASLPAQAASLRVQARQAARERQLAATAATAATPPDVAPPTVTPPTASISSTAAAGDPPFSPDPSAVLAAVGVLSVLTGAALTRAGRRRRGAHRRS